MLRIETNKLKAAMECVATGKEEFRYYLKGVLLEVTSCGDVHLVSTDGERMFCGRIPAAVVQWMDKRPEGTREIILPYDALKQAAKHRIQFTNIEHLGEDIYNINGIACQAINGYFPVWRNVVNTAFANIKSESAPMDWARVATVEKALREWSGNKNATVRVHGRGNGVGALVTGDDPNAFALVMPQRDKDQTPYATPCLPAALV
jgi:DNA polymerase III sliding clamp (beta) subunit (PCNA family)